MFSTLRAKLIAGFTILVLINVVVSVWSIYNFHELTSAVTTMIGQNYQNVIAAQSMLENLERDNSAQLLMLSGYSDAGYIQFQDNQKNFFAAFQQAVTSNGLEKKGAEILGRISSLYLKYSNDTDTLKETIITMRPRAAQDYHYNNIMPVLDTIKSECFQLLDINNSALVQADEKTNMIASQATLAVLGAALVAILMSIGASWKFSQYITEPAERLTDTVRKIGRGFLDVRADVSSRDEIGELSREFNKMAERIQQYEEINIEKLISEKNKSEAIVSTISDPIIVVDEAGKIILMNKLAEELFSIVEIDAVKKDFEAAIHNQDLAKYLRSSLEGKLLDIPPYFELKSGDENRYFRIKINPTLRSSGRIAGAILILQDVTQFKELDKIKSDFMARISHEFRTPLTSINMTLDILKDEHIGHVNKKQRELLAAGKQDAERLTKLVRELLELSRIESGKFKLKEDPVETKSLVEFSIQPVLLQFSDKNVGLVVNTDDTIPDFLADYQQLSWVISNLVTNALRFTEPGGTVTVDSSLNGDNLIVSVRDTGCGIVKEELDKVFDKFVQLLDSTSPSPGSVGLGLSIAKEIVEFHGGRIWVESQIGTGTVFTFSIPISNRIAGERKISA